MPAKDPIVCIANSLYSSDEMAAQSPAPAVAEVEDGGFADDNGDSGPEVIDLTATEGQIPHVRPCHSPNFCTYDCKRGTCCRHEAVLSAVFHPMQKASRGGGAHAVGNLCVR